MNTGLSAISPRCHFNLTVGVPAERREGFFGSLESFAVKRGFHHRISRYSVSKSWYGFDLWRDDVGIFALSAMAGGNYLVGFYEVETSPISATQREEFVSQFKGAVTSVPGVTVRDETKEQ